MATKEEIREWLKACGATPRVNIVYYFSDPNVGFVASFCFENSAIEHLHKEHATPLHLLNESLTGVQGPTFAEWKKQKGREGKILKIMDAYNEDSLYGHMGPAMAAKILDAIEGEGK